MNTRMFAVAALVLLLPVPLLAQRPGQEIVGGGRAGSPDGQEIVGGGSAAGSDRRQLEEDIEIMRRLLSRALAEPQTVTFSPDGRVLTIGSVDGSVHLWDSAAGKALRSVAFSPEGKIVATKGEDGTVRLWDRATGRLLSSSAAPAHAVGLEGAYLKGYGVVYTVTLPPQARPKKTGAAAPTAKPLSDWERVRKEIHGDKTEEAPPVSAAPLSLADVILHVLAQNGRHFTQLAANERLTVVVTFREPQQGTGLGSATALGMAGLAPGGMPMGGSGMGGKGGGLGLPGGMSGASGGKPARDYELAGDLHLRQNNVGHAVQAYKDALTILAKVVSSRASEAQARNIYRKLAQAYLSMADRINQQPGGNNTDRQLDMAIARAVEFLRKAQQLKDGSSPVAAAHLPAKLIVSAPKALLDQFGSGKMTFEEFRRAASVESVPALAPRQQPASKSK